MSRRSRLRDSLNSHPIRIFCPMQAPVTIIVLVVLLCGDGYCGNLPSSASGIWQAVQARPCGNLSKTACLHWERPAGKYTFGDQNRIANQTPLQLFWLYQPEISVAIDTSRGRPRSAVGYEAERDATLMSGPLAVGKRWSAAATSEDAKRFNSASGVRPLLDYRSVLPLSLLSVAEECLS
jgi:hypothetical protein